MLSSDSLRRAANLCLAIAQLILPQLLVSTTGSGDFDANAVAQQTGPTTPVEPAGHAFAAWSPIFIGSFACAVYQALPTQAQDPLLRRLGWLTATGFFLSRYGCSQPNLDRFGRPCRSSR